SRVEPTPGGGSRSCHDAAEVQPPAAELPPLPGHLHGGRTPGAPAGLSVRRVRLHPAGRGPEMADRQLAELRRQPHRSNRAVPAATAGHRLTAGTVPHQSQAAELVSGEASLLGHDQLGGIWEVATAVNPGELRPTGLIGSL